MCVSPHGLELCQIFGSLSITAVCVCVRVWQVCPADGRVLHLGRVGSDGRLEQIKGVSYPLHRFLGEQPGEGGVSPAVGGERELHYVTMYLSPGDYHGFHSPANWRAHTRRHFPGLCVCMLALVSWHCFIQENC